MVLNDSYNIYLHFDIHIKTYQWFVRLLAMKNLLKKLIFGQNLPTCVLSRGGNFIKRRDIMFLKVSKCSYDTGLHIYGVHVNVHLYVRPYGIFFRKNVRFLTVVSTLCRPSKGHNSLIPEDIWPFMVSNCSYDQYLQMHTSYDIIDVSARSYEPLRQCIH